MIILNKDNDNSIFNFDFNSRLDSRFLVDLAEAARLASFKSSGEPVAEGTVASSTAMIHGRGFVQKPRSSTALRPAALVHAQATPSTIPVTGGTAVARSKAKIHSSSTSSFGVGSLCMPCLTEKTERNVKALTNFSESLPIARESELDLHPQEIEEALAEFFGVSVTDIKLVDSLRGEAVQNYKLLSDPGSQGIERYEYNHGLIIRTIRQTDGKYKHYYTDTNVFIEELDFKQALENQEYNKKLITEHIGDNINVLEPDITPLFSQLKTVDPFHLAKGRLAQKTERKEDSSPSYYRPTDLLSRSTPADGFFQLDPPMSPTTLANIEQIEKEAPKVANLAYQAKGLQSNVWTKSSAEVGTVFQDVGGYLKKLFGFSKKMVIKTQKLLPFSYENPQESLFKEKLYAFEKALTQIEEDSSIQPTIKKIAEKLKGWREEVYKTADEAAKQGKTLVFKKETSEHLNAQTLHTKAKSGVYGNYVASHSDDSTALALVPNLRELPAVPSYVVNENQAIPQVTSSEPTKDSSSVTSTIKNPSKRISYRSPIGVKTGEGSASVQQENQPNTGTVDGSITGSGSVSGYGAGTVTGNSFRNQGNADVRVSELESEIHPSPTSNTQLVVYQPPIAAYTRQAEQWRSFTRYAPVNCRVSSITLNHSNFVFLNDSSLILKNPGQGIFAVLSSLLGVLIGGYYLYKYFGVFSKKPKEQKKMVESIDISVGAGPISASPTVPIKAIDSIFHMGKQIVGLPIFPDLSLKEELQNLKKK